MTCLSGAFFLIHLTAIFKTILHSSDTFLSLAERQTIQNNHLDLYSACKYFSVDWLHIKK